MKFKIQLTVTMALAAMILGFGWYVRFAMPTREGSVYSESPAIRHHEVSGFRSVSRSVVESPRPAYDFKLTSQSETEVSLAGLSGKVVLVSFVYTNCHEACPLLTENYLSVQERFLAEVRDGLLTLVLITTDPDQDTPERLRDYTLGRGGRWLFLTGSLKELTPVWDGFGIYRELRKGLQEIVIYHSYKTYLVDRRGMVRYVYEGMWQPADMVPDLQRLLSE